MYDANTNANAMNIQQQQQQRNQIEGKEDDDIASGEAIVEEVGVGDATGEEGGVEGGEEGDGATPAGGVGEGGSGGGEVFEVEGGEDEAEEEERVSLVLVAYSDDVYDRIWLPDTIVGFTTSSWEPFRASYNSDTLSSNDYKPPHPVMATAVRPVNGLNSLNFSVEFNYRRQPFYVYMHFAEIETLAADQKREFDIYINDAPFYKNVVTNFLKPVTIFSKYGVSADLQLKFSIRATKESTLPPILNAIEVHEVLELQSPTPTNQSEGMSNRYTGWRGTGKEIHVSQKSTHGKTFSATMMEIPLESFPYEMVEERRIRQFKHSELVTITKNFEKPIGRGGFGSVYAGHLTDGTQVAVQLLSKAHHQNLVSIIGYCNEGQHMGLVYEYMANGTLKEHLSEKNPKILSWENRLQIACDAAEGLAYLHDGCKPPIIHRDIKTANILLTENMQAKVSDFGLSRLMPSDGGTHVSTLAAGTPGYVDPEYLEFNKLNEKSDVYSFGVVLLELITGKPAILKPPEDTLLAKWIVPMVERAQIKEIMDSRLNSDFDTNSAWKALETAMPCVELSSNRRQVMRQVVINLRECLEMEKARVKARKENEEHNSVSGNTNYVTVESSFGGPSAR
ncbi:hypothetical protein RHGRI_025056 [Rhododendron griersonianum]|uniref:Protein kinase domain-containing protein n=1 Tax=Rhododendron griersonianum TaxID=479676 RepID=A0AAV6JEI3_9ERIC|nr:hypothetical protein RHGRI_025056 [Rhododendron griersonianum]